MVSIRDRPATRDTDGAWFPGHLEGDLIVGAGSKSAIGTMVERSTGYLWLLHLPHGHTAAEVAAALTDKLAGWPPHLKQSLTWDQGKGISLHAQVSVDANIKIYFADPHSPWQRPGNENINGLLRQYFPKAPTCPCTAAATSTTFKTSSTTGPEPASLTLSPTSSCKSFCCIDDPRPPWETDRW